MKAFVGLLLALFSASGAAQTANLNSVLDVKNAVRGCATIATGDGTTDDSLAFQCRANLLASTTNSGGVLHIPAGTYFFAHTVTIPTNVVVEGVGEASTIVQTRAYLGEMFKLSTGTTLKRVKFTQVQPTPGPGWAPYQDYAFQVAVVGSRVNIEDVMLLNPANGIRIQSDTCPSANGLGAVGQIYINNVRGQPLHQGIVIDCALDIIRINDIHFWPFWSGDTSVLNFTKAASFGIRSYRNDNPFFSQIFTYGYYTGIEFGKTPGNIQSIATGYTSRPRINGFDCDSCATGIRISADYTNGVLVNKMQFCATSPYAYAALTITANHVSASVSQLDATNAANNIIYVDGDYNYVLVSDSFFREWNVSGIGFPAVQTTNGTNTKVQISNTFYGNSHGAPFSTGNVTTNYVTASPGIFP